VTLDGVREGKGEGMGCRKKKSGIVVRMRSMKHSAAGAVEKIDNLEKKAAGIWLERRDGEVGKSLAH